MAQADRVRDSTEVSTESRSPFIIAPADVMIGTRYWFDKASQTVSEEEKCLNCLAQSTAHRKEFLLRPYSHSFLLTLASVIGTPTPIIANTSLYGKRFVSLNLVELVITALTSLTNSSAQLGTAPYSIRMAVELTTTVTICLPTTYLLSYHCKPTKQFPKT
jgi:hypothetical protein